MRIGGAEIMQYASEMMMTSSSSAVEALNLKEASSWWSDVNESPIWQDRIFHALAVLYGVVSIVAVVRTQRILILVLDWLCNDEINVCLGRFNWWESNWEFRNTGGRRRRSFTFSISLWMEVCAAIWLWSRLFSLLFDLCSSCVYAVRAVVFVFRRDVQFMHPEVHHHLSGLSMSNISKFGDYLCRFCNISCLISQV